MLRLFEKDPETHIDNRLVIDTDEAVLEILNDKSTPVFRRSPPEKLPSILNTLGRYGWHETEVADGENGELLAQMIITLDRWVRNNDKINEISEGEPVLRLRLRVSSPWLPKRQVEALAVLPPALAALYRVTRGISVSANCDFGATSAEGYRDLLTWFGSKSDDVDPQREIIVDDDRGPFGRGNNSFTGTTYAPSTGLFQAYEFGIQMSEPVDEATFLQEWPGRIREFANGVLQAVEEREC